MAITRWDPWSELAALQQDVNQLFGRGTTPARAATANLVPAIDAYRDDEAMVVTVELPGMSPDDVEIEVENGMLTLGGERRLVADVDQDRWIRRERAVGRFERSFTLPEGTDPEKITATFENGVLTLRVPHPPERRPHRVEIGATEGSGQNVEIGESS